MTSLLWAVSRAPLAKLQATSGGWVDLPWASSFAATSTSTFSVSVTEEQQRDGAEYNYKREAPVAGTPSRPTSGGAAKGAAKTGTDVATYTRERPGMSAFVLEHGVAYHTYSAYARGLDGLWGAYQWLDGTPRDATSRTSGGAATTSTPTKVQARAEARLQALADASQRRGKTAARSPASRAFRPYI
jgi:predicted dithiol-disulfide oxidoreductase (DUF899 family)